MSSLLKLSPIIKYTNAKNILPPNFFIFILITESLSASSGDSLTLAPFGKVHIYKKTGVPKNVIILISGDEGWKTGVVGFAESFSEMENLVIGVDILRYFKNLKQRTGDCYKVTADFVELATFVEKKYKLSDYTPPVLMGYSSGATLVYGVMAQSRPGTFKGGISLGFCPDIDLPKMLCQTNGLSEKTDVTGKSFFLEPDPKLGNHWIVLQGELDKVCKYSEVADFVSKTNNAELVALPEVGHGFSKWKAFMPQWKDSFNRLIEKYEKDQPAEISIDQLKNLPVVTTDSKIQDKEAPLALLISGDGGWYSFEQLMADNLASYGIPTLGLDSKKYLWNRRTPEETAGDIAMALSYYSKKWGRDQFLLIGYSLGAEILPFIINRLPDEMRLKIVSTVLLSPAVNTDFEIHISNMLGMGSYENSYNVPGEIIKMKAVPTLCIFGEDEKSGYPELLKRTQVKIDFIPGDHHYKYNWSLLVQTMKKNNSF